MLCRLCPASHQLTFCPFLLQTTSLCTCLHLPLNIKIFTDMLNNYFDRPQDSDEEPNPNADVDTIDPDQLKKMSDNITVWSNDVTICLKELNDTKDESLVAFVFAQEDLEEMQRDLDSNATKLNTHLTAVNNAIAASNLDFDQSFEDTSITPFINARAFRVRNTVMRTYLTEIQQEHEALMGLLKMFKDQLAAKRALQSSSYAPKRKEAWDTQEAKRRRES